MAEQNWVLPVDDDGVITFPEDLIEKMGWSEGTVLKWDVKEDGSISLTAASDADPQDTSEPDTTLQQQES